MVFVTVVIGLPFGLIACVLMLTGKAMIAAADAIKEGVEIMIDHCGGVS